MRLGIYVGSFDPVHKAHIHVVNHLIENDYVDKVIIIPSVGYWDKTNLAELEKRIEMLKFYENNNIIINNTLNTLSYTYEVLRELKNIYKDDLLYLIIGADNVEKFYLWKNVDEILENKILVLPRNDIDPTEYISKYSKKDNFIRVKDFEPLYISSTEIRNKIKNNDLSNINNYLDEEVLDYIIKSNLYKGGEI